MVRLRTPLLLLLVLATSCLRAPYQRYEGKRYRLAMPLSGPHLAHANGQGEGTVLKAGTVVQVRHVRMEQKVQTMEDRWCTRCDLPAPCPEIYEPKDGQVRQCPRYGPPVYYVDLTGPAACGNDGCEAVWVMDGLDTFETRFKEVFGPIDPHAPPPPSGKVPLGATPEVVRSYLGLADVEDAGAHDAVWRYQRMRCTKDGLLERQAAVEVRFREGKVVGVRDVHGVGWEPDGQTDHALVCK